MVYPSLAARLPAEGLYNGFWGTLIERAAACSKCHECEERCPYHLPISDMIAEFYEQFENDKMNYLKISGAR
jgi:predicted aldo/keto reductase-like oxidoreductase